MQAIFEYIDKQTPQVICGVVVVAFIGWLFYEFYNIMDYDGDDF